ncbi:hypothetical protein LIER_36927 [Lithospermum erythrorhizon]|uniref:Uncharacterized protein n=1 Tax=Lithospermum erythrorhizon TaxID=34254 RepID=A0AAV3PCQ5_LITER
MKFRGWRTYVGGWVRLGDLCKNDKMFMMSISMGYFELSVPDTICYYYYKRPFDYLDNGLLQLKTDANVYDMTKWILGVIEISLYVTDPTKEMVRSMLYGQLYSEVRESWPKCVLKELENE